MALTQLSNGDSGAVARARINAGFTAVDALNSAIDTDVTLAANSDGKIATQKATKTYVDQIVAAQDAMVFKGVIDCSANPNYPAADCGWTYRASVGGRIGGASGVVVQTGDILLSLIDGTASGTQATVGARWTIIQANIDGAVLTTDIGVTVQGYNAATARTNAAQTWLASQTFVAETSFGGGGSIRNDGVSGIAFNLDVSDYLYFNRASDFWQTAIAGVEAHRIEGTAPSAGTNVLLLRNNGAATSTERILLGGADSGGAGYRLLRIAN